MPLSFNSQYGDHDQYMKVMTNPEEHVRGNVWLNKKTRLEELNDKLKTQITEYVKHIVHKRNNLINNSKNPTKIRPHTATSIQTEIKEKFGISLADVDCNKLRMQTEGLINSKENDNLSNSQIIENSKKDSNEINNNDKNVENVVKSDLTKDVNQDKKEIQEIKDSIDNKQNIENQKSEETKMLSKTSDNFLNKNDKDANVVDVKNKTMDNINYKKSETNKSKKNDIKKENKKPKKKANAVISSFSSVDLNQLSKEIQENEQQDKQKEREEWKKKREKIENEIKQREEEMLKKQQEKEESIIMYSKTTTYKDLYDEYFEHKINNEEANIGITNDENLFINI